MTVGAETHHRTRSVDNRNIRVFCVKLKKVWAVELLVFEAECNRAFTNIMGSVACALSLKLKPPAVILAFSNVSTTYNRIGYWWDLLLM